MSTGIPDPLAQEIGRGLPILGSGCSHPAALIAALTCCFDGSTVPHPAGAGPERQRRGVCPRIGSPERVKEPLGSLLMQESTTVAADGAEQPRLAAGAGQDVPATTDTSTEVPAANPLQGRPVDIGCLDRVVAASHTRPSALGSVRG